MAAKNDGGSDRPAGGAATQEVMLRVDERNLRTSYANAFRTNATAEEVLLDFGLNLLGPPSREGGQPDIIFQVNERVVLNYFQAKRLALALGQVVSRHEEQFGVLELDINKRRKSGS
jgi:hypothetical protein